MARTDDDAWDVSENVGATALGAQSTWTDAGMSDWIGLG
jgi:hypothetical protein